MRGRARRTAEGGRRSIAVFAGTVVGLACFASPSFAAAPTKGECVDADTQAQSLRREDKLTEARVQLLICADVACPKMVRDDCAQRIDELNGAQPTLAFAAKDAAGADLSAVKVTVDGAPFADKLDGSSLAVDPGEHAFTFVAAGQPPVTLHIVVHEGEKARREVVAIGAPTAPVPARQAPAPPPAAAAPVPVTPSPHETTTTSSSAGDGQRVAGIVVGGVGVLGVALGAIFGAKASSDFSAQKSACGTPGCSPTDHALAVSDHDDATKAGTVATVALIAGGALVAGGITLFVTAPRGKESDGSSALRIVPSFGRGSGAMLLRGSF